MLNCAAQEWWGINEDIKEKAMMLHQRGGCRVFIPDIYKGKTTVEVAEAKHVRIRPYLLDKVLCCAVLLRADLQARNLLPVLPSHHYLAHAEADHGTALRHISCVSNTKVHGLHAAT